MTGKNENDHILRCCQFFHQYIIDMYAKIESERQLFIRINLKKLGSEEYTRLRGAISYDVYISNIGKMAILPATYTFLQTI